MLKMDTAFDIVKSVQKKGLNHEDTMESYKNWVPDFDKVFEYEIKYVCILVDNYQGNFSWGNCPFI